MEQRAWHGVLRFWIIPAIRRSMEPPRATFALPTAALNTVTNRAGGLERLFRSLEEEALSNSSSSARPR
jgi:hypothetical protein